MCFNTINEIESIVYTGFTPGQDTVTIDLGSVSYNSLGTITTINLTGFNVSDKLAIKGADGLISGTTDTNPAANILFQGTANVHDTVVWNTALGTVNIKSIQSSSAIGAINIMGLPTGLVATSTNFAFV